MRLLGKLALGGGIATAATTGLVLGVGVLTTSATLVLLDPVAPRADAREKALEPFDSCTELRDWYVDNAVKEVGPYGWDHVMWAYRDGDLRAPLGSPVVESAVPMATAADAASAQAPSTTGTNTQEAAVDEPDVAKTDGSIVVRVVDDRWLVVVDVSGEEAEVLDRVELPRNGYESQLLLVGDHVLVTQQVNAPMPDAADSIHPMPYYGGGPSVTRVLDYDITDPSSPRLLSTDRYTGRLLSARLYGETVRLLTSTGRPELDWVMPKKGVSEKQATRANRELVRRTTIDQWLPAVTRGDDRQDLVRCSDVLHPKKFTGAETVSVTAFDVETPEERTTVAVTAEGQIVYSSTDRLYVASADYEPVRPMASSRMPFQPSAPRTAVHAFDVTGAGTSYVGSGSVLGSLRDRWSLDEHDGHLRVAWSRYGRNGKQHNGISVLSERDGALRVVAEIKDLGIDEDLQSVRWFDDLAVLVTFRQIDPLYTIDLSDQTRPKVLGELKIPGYSGYLHPIGDHLILGLGVDADNQGRQKGAQAAVFDITDPRNAKQVSKHRFGKETYLGVLEDPLGFTWVPGSRTALTPVSSWYDDSADLASLRVTPTGRLDVNTLTDLNQSWGARTFALPDGRIAVLDRNRVRLIDG